MILVRVRQDHASDAGEPAALELGDEDARSDVERRSRDAAPVDEHRLAILEGDEHGISLSERR
jgi:hypothetical protein